MEIVEEKLQDKHFLHRIYLWSCLGPCLLLLSVFVSSGRFVPGGFYLPFIATLFFPFCHAWKLRGWFLASALLMVFFLMNVPKLPTELFLWETALLVALILALAVSALCFDEIHSLFVSIKRESSIRLNKLLEMDQRQNDQEKLWVEEKKGLQQEMKLYLRKKEDLDQVIEAKDQLLLAMERDLKGLLQEKQELTDALEQLRLSFQTDQKPVFQGQQHPLQSSIKEIFEREQSRLDQTNHACIENFQLKLDKKQGFLNYNDAMVQRQRYEKKIARLKNQLERYQKRGGQTQNLEHLHQQLRKQFEDKDQLLHQTRVKLFQAEEKLMAYEKERQIKQGEPSAYEKIYQTYLQDVEKDRAELELESQQMHEIIAALHQELAGCKSKN